MDRYVPAIPGTSELCPVLSLIGLVDGLSKTISMRGTSKVTGMRKLRAALLSPMASHEWQPPVPKVFRHTILRHLKPL